MKKGKKKLPTEHKARISVQLRLTEGEYKMLTEVSDKVNEFYLSRTLRRLIKEAHEETFRAKVG